ncbi:MAG: N-acyl-D-glucosamine 2-epimerase, partial [Marinilabiliales bacterium]
MDNSGNVSGRKRTTAGGSEDKGSADVSGKRPPAENVIAELRDFALQELENNLLPFWGKRMADRVNGGFLGAVNQEGNPLPGEPKGLILNARMLWTFAAVYNHDKRYDYMDLALRAWDYIATRFADVSFGGYFWTVDESGNPLDTKKQTYAQAFVIYAFAEYYRACGRQEVLDAAIRLYRLIEEKCAEGTHGGYLEAFSRSWGEISDSRLSEKDMNERKTMNTHLHVLEAYTSLLGVWNDKGLKERLKHLITVFDEKIVGPGNVHQKLFFNELWECRSEVISYGHDIEASWLLYEAAQAAGDPALADNVAELSLRLANGAAEGVNRFGGLTHESDGKGGTDGEMEWWAQAESVVGFLNAWR